MLRNSPDAQADALAPGVNRDNLNGDTLVGSHDFPWMLHMLVGQLRDVNQPLKTILQTGERTEFGEVRDRGLDKLADVVFLLHRGPGIALQTL